MRRPILRKRRGGADVVVFVHGSMDSAASFQQVADGLAGWTAVGYDRRGWGASRTLAGPETRLADHVDDLLDILRVLITPAVLAGHSFGGLVAMCAAAVRPDLVRALVVYEPPVPWLPWWPGLAPWERSVREARTPEEAADALHRAVVGTPVAKATAALEGVSLVREMTDPTVGIPTFDPCDLAVHTVTVSGGSSLPHHRETARHLADLVVGGVHREIPGAGHLAHLSHPDDLAELIRHWKTGDSPSARNICRGR